MQDPDAATLELERAVGELGLVSCSVGWSYGPTQTLGHPDYDGLLAKAVELDVPVMIHPVALGQSTDLISGGAEWLSEYDLDSLWGYIYVETAAIVGMIFSGALDRHPDLRLFVPHGGGMVPYHVGRVEQYAALSKQRAGPIRLQRSIPEYLEQFYFDTIVHDPRGMKLLIDVMGPDNVVLGTNWSGWDDAPLWELIRGLDGISDQTKAKILGLNATERLYRARAARRLRSGSPGRSSGPVGATRCSKPSSSSTRPIVHGRLCPGAVATQVHLAQMLGVGRTPLREALRIAHSDGLVEFGGRKPRSPSSPRATPRTCM